MKSFLCRCKYESDGKHYFESTFDDLSEPLWKLSRFVGITPMSTHTRLKERAPAGRGLLDI